MAEGPADLEISIIIYLIGEMLKNKFHIGGIVYSFPEFCLSNC